MQNIGKRLGIALVVAAVLLNEAGLLAAAGQRLEKPLRQMWTKMAQPLGAAPGGAAGGAFRAVPEELLSVRLPQPVAYPAADLRGAVDVRRFGAQGDGRTDDTISIQAAIDSLPASGGCVYIPPGTYLVDAVRSIRLGNNVTLAMTPQTVLKALPNDAEWSAVLRVADVDNVTILNGVVQGERYEHQGKKGEWGMGVMITGSTRVTVQGTEANACWGDGFYIGSELVDKLAEDVRLIDVQAGDNRRQGISLICGRNIEIVRPRIRHTHGTPPAAGIDIEPNRLSDVLENVRILSPYTEGNEGSGITVNLHNLNGTKNLVQIEVIDHQDDGSERGFLVSGNELVPGRLLLERPRWHHARQNGLAVLVHDYRSFRIDVQEPVIVDCNRSGQAFRNTGSAIAIYDFKNNLASWQSTVGNVQVRQAQLVDTQSPPRTVAPFHFWAIPGKQLREVAIVNPGYYGSMAALPVTEEMKPFVQNP